jgi:hypothetical protein
MNAQYQHIINNIDTINLTISSLNSKVDSITSRLKKVDDACVKMHKVASKVDNLTTDRNPYMKVFYVAGPASVVFDVPGKPDIVFVTMVGAGGAGGLGNVSSGVGGAGGGGGEAVIRRPISLVGSSGRLMITAGLGGSANGSDSTVELETLNDVRSPIVAKGGSSGEPTLVGFGAVSTISRVYDGQDGEVGQISLGGAGGTSHFAIGGSGGLNYYVKDALGKTVLNPRGQDGSFGSGGGGSSPGSIAVGQGGHGFVMIEYPSSAWFEWLMQNRTKKITRKNYKKTQKLKELKESQYLRYRVVDLRIFYFFI